MLAVNPKHFVDPTVCAEPCIVRSNGIRLVRVPRRWPGRRLELGLVLGRRRVHLLLLGRGAGRLGTVVSQSASRRRDENRGGSSGALGGGPRRDPYQQKLPGDKDVHEIATPTKERYKKLNTHRSHVARRVDPAAEVRLLRLGRAAHHVLRPHARPAAGLGRRVDGDALGDERLAGLERAEGAPAAGDAAREDGEEDEGDCWIGGVSVMLVSDRRGEEGM
jgi:hypothetical protein